VTRAELARRARPTRWDWWECGELRAVHEVEATDTRAGYSIPYRSHTQHHAELGGRTHEARIRAELGARVTVTAWRPTSEGFDAAKFYTLQGDPAGRRFSLLRLAIDAAIDWHRPELEEERPRSHAPELHVGLEPGASTDQPTPQGGALEAPPGRQEGTPR